MGHVLTSVSIISRAKPVVFLIEMRKYMIGYRANPLDYDATVQKALQSSIKVEFGGGRKTIAGESPNAQIIFNLKNIDSKIVIGRTGKIQIYYPSVPNLQKCVDVVQRCYVPIHGQLHFMCEGPVDPLDRAFQYVTKINWNGTGLVCSEALTYLYHWYDPKTGEFVFTLPDQEGRIVPPGPGLNYLCCVPIRAVTVDKDDSNGNRIVTGERLRWQAIQELKRIVREHPRFKPETRI